jgi:hypothetical protein
MAVKYLQIPVDEYGTIQVEIEPAEDISGLKELGIDKRSLESAGGFEDLGLEEELEERAQAVTVAVSSAFQRVVDTVRTVAYGFWDRLSQLEEGARPDEASVKFGLALKADAGVVLTQVGGEGNFEIELTWKPSARSQEREDVDRG